MGQPRTEALAHPEDAVVRIGAHAPCVLSERRGHAERTQLAERLDGRADVLVEPGHAVAAPGLDGPAAPPEQAHRRHVHGLPPQRGEQLHRGQRGGHGVLGLPARQQSGGHALVRRPPGPRHGCLHQRRPRRHRLFTLVLNVFLRLDGQIMEYEGWFAYLSDGGFDADNP